MAHNLEKSVKYRIDRSESCSIPKNYEFVKLSENKLAEERAVAARFALNTSSACKLVLFITNDKFKPTKNTRKLFEENLMKYILRKALSGQKRIGSCNICKFLCLDYRFENPAEGISEKNLFTKNDSRIRTQKSLKFDGLRPESDVLDASTVFMQKRTSGNPLNILSDIELSTNLKNNQVFQIPCAKNEFTKTDNIFHDKVASMGKKTSEILASELLDERKARHLHRKDLDKSLKISERIAIIRKKALTNVEKGHDNRHNGSKLYKIRRLESVRIKQRKPLPSGLKEISVSSIAPYNTNSITSLIPQKLRDFQSLKSTRNMPKKLLDFESCPDKTFPDIEFLEKNNACSSSPQITSTYLHFMFDIFSPKVHHAHFDPKNPENGPLKPTYNKIPDYTTVFMKEYETPTIRVRNSMKDFCKLQKMQYPNLRRLYKAYTPRSMRVAELGRYIRPTPVNSLKKINMKDQIFGLTKAYKSEINSPDKSSDMKPDNKSRFTSAEGDLAFNSTYPFLTAKTVKEEEYQPLSLNFVPENKSLNNLSDESFNKQERPNSDQRQLCDNDLISNANTSKHNVHKKSYTYDFICRNCSVHNLNARNKKTVSSRDFTGVESHPQFIENEILRRRDTRGNNDINRFSESQSKKDLNNKVHSQKAFSNMNIKRQKIDSTNSNNKKKATTQKVSEQAQIFHRKTSRPCSKIKHATPNHEDSDFRSMPIENMYFENTIAKFQLGGFPANRKMNFLDTGRTSESIDFFRRNNTLYEDIGPHEEDFRFSHKLIEEKSLRKINFTLKNAHQTIHSFPSTPDVLINHVQNRSHSTQHELFQQSYVLTATRRIFRKYCLNLYDYFHVIEQEPSEHPFSIRFFLCLGDIVENEKYFTIKDNFLTNLSEKPRKCYLSANISPLQKKDGFENLQNNLKQFDSPSLRITAFESLPKSNETNKLLRYNKINPIQDPNYDLKNTYTKSSVNDSTAAVNDINNQSNILSKISSAIEKTHDATKPESESISVKPTSNLASRENQFKVVGNVKKDNEFFDFNVFGASNTREAAWIDFKNLKSKFEIGNFLQDQPSPTFMAYKSILDQIDQLEASPCLSDAADLKTQKVILNGLEKYRNSSFLDAIYTFRAALRMPTPVCIHLLLHFYLTLCHLLCGQIFEARFYALNGVERAHKGGFFKLYALFSGFVFYLDWFVGCSGFNFLYPFFQYIFCRKLATFHVRIFDTAKYCRKDSNSWVAGVIKTASVNWLKSLVLSIENIRDKSDTKSVESQCKSIYASNNAYFEPDDCKLPQNHGKHVKSFVSVPGYSIAENQNGFDVVPSESDSNQNIKCVKRKNTNEMATFAQNITDGNKDTFSNDFIHNNNNVAKSTGEFHKSLLSGCLRSDPSQFPYLKGVCMPKSFESCSQCFLQHFFAETTTLLEGINSQSTPEAKITILSKIGSVVDFLETQFTFCKDFNNTQKPKSEDRVQSCFESLTENSKKNFLHSMCPLQHPGHTQVPENDVFSPKNFQNINLICTSPDCFLNIKNNYQNLCYNHICRPVTMESTLSLRILKFVLELLEKVMYFELKMETRCFSEIFWEKIASTKSLPTQIKRITKHPFRNHIGSDVNKNLNINIVSTINRCFDAFLEDINFVKRLLTIPRFFQMSKNALTYDTSLFLEIIAAMTTLKFCSNGCMQKAVELLNCVVYCAINHSQNRNCVFKLCIRCIGNLSAPNIYLECIKGCSAAHVNSESVHNLFTVKKSLESNKDYAEDGVDSENVENLLIPKDTSKSTRDSSFNIGSTHTNDTSSINIDSKCSEMLSAPNDGDTKYQSGFNSRITTMISETEKTCDEKKINLYFHSEFNHKISGFQNDIKSIDRQRQTIVKTSSTNSATNANSTDQYLSLSDLALKISIDYEKNLDKTEINPFEHMQSLDMTQQFNKVDPNQRCSISEEVASEKCSNPKLKNYSIYKDSETIDSHVLDPNLKNLQSNCFSNRSNYIPEKPFTAINTSNSSNFKIFEGSNDTSLGITKKTPLENLTEGSNHLHDSDICTKTAGHALGNFIQDLPHQLFANFHAQLLTNSHKSLQMALSQARHAVMTALSGYSGICREERLNNRLGLKSAQIDIFTVSMFVGRNGNLFMHLLKENLLLEIHVNWQEQMASMQLILGRSKSCLKRTVKTSQERREWWAERRLLDQSLLKLIQNLDFRINEVLKENRLILVAKKSSFLVQDCINHNFNEFRRGLYDEIQLSEKSKNFKSKKFVLPEAYQSMHCSEHQSCDLSLCLSQEKLKSHQENLCPENNNKLILSQKSDANFQGQENSFKDSKYIDIQKYTNIFNNIQDKNISTEQNTHGLNNVNETYQVSNIICNQRIQNSIDPQNSNFLKTKTTGIKLPSIQKATNYDDLALSQDSSHENKSSYSHEKIVETGEHVFLITDEETANFPFEMLEIFDQNAVYRIPNVKYAHRNKNIDPIKQINSLSYILDPDDNLKNTKDTFEKYFKIFKEAFQNLEVTGITGTKPTYSEWTQSSKSDIFCYFGHGTGEKYYRKDDSLKSNSGEPNNKQPAIDNNRVASRINPQQLNSQQKQESFASLQGQTITNNTGHEIPIEDSYIPRSKTMNECSRSVLIEPTYTNLLKEPINPLYLDKNHHLKSGSTNKTDTNSVCINKTELYSHSQSATFNNNIVFLFGCSSSKLKCAKNFDRNGVVLKYLEKCRIFLGCMWDVTDKDLDRFCLQLFNYMFEEKKPWCLAKMVKNARNAMKLKYINGAAVVIWGIPTYVNI